MINLFYSHYTIENYAFKFWIVNHTCPKLLHYILFTFSSHTHFQAPYKKASVATFHFVKLKLFLNHQNG